MKSATYGQFKNHVHNTLGITKDDIREMVNRAVVDIVERRLDVSHVQDAIPRMIDDSIRERSFHALMFEDDTSLTDSIQAKVAQEVSRAILQDIGITVKLKKPLDKKS